MQELTPFVVAANVNEYEANDLDIPACAELNHIIDIFRSSSDSTVRLSHTNLSPLEAKAQIGPQANCKT